MIVITTLDNEAAVAKTFTKIGNSMTESKWLNTTDDSVAFHNTIEIKQQTVKPKGAPARRRSLVSGKTEVVDVTTGNVEDTIINITVSQPLFLQNTTSTQRADVLSYLRDLMTAAVLGQLSNGEV